MRIVKTLLISLVITWGLLALAVRATTPLLADYRERLAVLASERLGVPVDIGFLKARWYGLRPLLELRELSVGEGPRAIRVERVELDLAPAGLLHGTLADALRVTVDGLQLTAIREPTGQIHVEGLGDPAQSAGGGAPQLPSHIRLIDTRVIWIDRKAGRAPLPLDDINILLDRDGESLAVRAQLHTPAGRAQLSAKLRGRLVDTGWSGDSYLRVDDLDVARLFANYLPAHYGLDSTAMDLQAWTRWSDAAPVHSQGRFALRDVNLRPQHGAALDLSLLAANFSVDRSSGDLRLGLQSLELATPERRWPRSDLALAVSGNAGGSRRIDLAAGYLRLEDIASIVRVRLPWETVATALDSLQPRGEVRGLRLRAEVGAGPATWQVRARFDGITTEPWDRVPGVENLSGELHGGRDHAVLTLDSHDARLRFGKLFRDPLVLPRIAGRIDVVTGDDGWRVSSESLQADAAHLRTVTRVHLEQRPGESLFLDLQSDFRDGDAAFASRYYPTAIMGEGVVRWLDRSIKSGRVISGSALVYGPLDDFAFEHSRSGTFQVLFDTDDIELDYREGWPPLRQLDARVKFHGNQLDIGSRAGSVYDSRIESISAHIGSLNPASPIRIRGRLAGPLQNNLRVLKEPALRPRFGRFAEILRGDGDSTLDLDFQLPLGGTGDYVLDGRLQFAGNRLSLPDWDFALHGIDGRLDFTLDGLRASDIRATALGSQVRVDVLPVGDGATRVRARGRFDPTDVGRRFGGPTINVVHGTADVVVDVDVPAARAVADPATLSVSSGLHGVAVDLPAPLGKTANARRELVVSVPLGEPGLPGRVRYGDNLAARFSPDGQRIDIVLGGGRANPHPQQGIRIGGRLARFDLQAWLAATDRLPQVDGAGAQPLHIDLRIDEVDTGALGLHGLRIDARRRGDGWSGKVDATELAGRFVVPTGPGRETIDVALDRLALKLPPGDRETPPPPDPASGPDPTDLAGLKLDIAQLSVDAADLGELRLLAQPTADGLRITRLTLAGGQLNLDANGSWARGKTGYRTRLAGHADTPDLGKLLVDIGYSRQLEEAPGSTEFELDWPGGPDQVHRATLRGDLDFEIGQGRLVELDPGVTRVVGLLNLNALTRRLRLDFSDFYKKGYSFDRITGGFVFADGSATTENLRMTGPTGRIEITGSTDLVAETLDQKVAVTPNLDATLPIAGTLAGGPVAGIAVLVAQKVMSKQVDDINRFDYRVTGPWAQPEVVQLTSGGTLSKLLRPFSGGGESGGGETAPADGSQPATPAATQTPAPDDDRDVQSEGDSPGGPLRGLLDVLKKGKPYGADIPGE